VVHRYLVVGLRGGLGNQLFQYASGYGIAQRLGAELFFDDARLRDNERWLPELLGPYYLRATRQQRLRLGIVHGSDRLYQRMAQVALPLVVDASRWMRQMTPRTMPPCDRAEDAGRYDEQILSVDLPTQLLGWFQSEKYFAHVADEIVQRLRFPQQTLSSLGQRPSVALSFRRGDYIRYGWQLPLSYYERALDVVLRMVPDASFLVLGDDPEFVRLATEWISRFGPARNAYDLSGDPLEHLVLASECDHAVIANSSFAWWAAWLGDRQPRDVPRLVVAPEDYTTRFGPDVLRENWVAVPST
jgi:hypothetical protein